MECLQIFEIFEKNGKRGPRKVKILIKADIFVKVTNYKVFAYRFIQNDERIQEINALVDSLV